MSEPDLLYELRRRGLNAEFEDPTLPEEEHDDEEYDDDDEDGELRAVLGEIAGNDEETILA